MILKVGHLVLAGYQGGPMKFTGIVTYIDDAGFDSLKGHKETVVHVLSEETIKYFTLEEDNIEVIDE